MSIAVYPGSFDPVTCGHLDIITRCSKLYDKVIIAVLHNSAKKPMFAAEERVALINKTITGLPNCSAEAFDGLLVDFVQKKQADTVIKGLRAISDFEYEFQRALLLKKIDNDLETVFIMTNAKYSFVSSSGVRELATFGGQLKDLVPECIEERVRKHVYKKFE